MSSSGFMFQPRALLTKSWLLHPPQRERGLPLLAGERCGESGF